MDQDKEEERQRVAELAQQALQANREHLDALKTYTQKLEAELETLDKLLNAADAIDNSDLDLGCSVAIPGSVRATAPIAIKELLSSESPFYEDALRHSHYQSFSEVHPMKSKELEALVEAVQAESHRQRALDMQKKGCMTLPNMEAQTTHISSLNTEGIDWDRIAEKVSALSMTTRTAKECEIRWLGDQKPEFNHEPWSNDEVLKVRSLAAEVTDRRPDWTLIAERLGTGRTPLDCMRHAIPRKVHQWTKDADERLLKAIRMYGHDNWHLVARYVSEDATPSQCSNRFQKTLDSSIKRTAWSPDEDSRLSAAVAAYGSSWVDVAANITGRHNDQCRDRWTEQVNPAINKSEWSKEEDRLLLDHVGEHENASWKEISEHLCNGRTESMCRHRHAALKKDANTVLEMPGMNYEVQTTSDGVSSNFVAFRNVHSPSTSAPHYTENQHLKQLVFLEPVVLNPERRQYRSPGSSQPQVGSETMTVGNIGDDVTTTLPPSKKRKTRSNVAKPRKSRSKLNKGPQAKLG